MGCCLSREDDRFNSGNEALLPKGRNGNKRVDKSMDGDLAGTNGSYKSPSAVVAAGNATSKVSATPQLPKKAVESVDLLGLNNKSPTSAAAPVIKASSVPKPTSNVERAPTPSEPTSAPTVKAEASPKPVANEPSPFQSAAKEPSPPKPVTKEPSPSVPTESSLPQQAESSSSKQTKTSSTKPLETANEELMVSAFTSVKPEHVDNDNNDDGDDNSGKAKEPNPKKINPTKKSKKKRKKGKK